MRDYFQPNRDDIKLSAVLYALSDPIRLQIVRRLLVETELSCKDFGPDPAKSTLSHHFKTLREAGVTSKRPVGTVHYISLRKDDLEARFPGLLRMVAGATEPF